MAGLNFRIGETKRTTVRELEIEIETAPEVPIQGRPSQLLKRLITLNPGQHRFQLVVEDELGRLSEPATVAVTVLAPS